MKESLQVGGNVVVYYRLIALWVLCEAMLGGIIHGLRIPVSGLVVGSCAIICICLIAWYVPQRGGILKATLIVAIFKMMLSPQAPPPAYIAVFFQGLLGELLFWRRRFYAVSCFLLAILGLLESGLQRILVLTIIYGNDLWTVINQFLNGLTGQKTTTNYSLWIGGGYVALHFFMGLFIGWWASILPFKIAGWNNYSTAYIPATDQASSQEISGQPRRRKKVKKILVVIWVLLLGLYVQSYFKIGNPILPAHVALKIFLRSLIIVIAWAFIIGPLLTKLLHRWLQSKKTRARNDIESVLQLLPTTQSLISQCWMASKQLKGLTRLKWFTRSVLASMVSSATTDAGSTGTFKEETATKPIYLLSGPVQSGKTSSLLAWSADRNDVFGILTPVVNGERMFMDVHTREVFSMEARPGETDVLLVGRFVFSKPQFDKAVRVLRTAIHQQGWLLVDEIGPLELHGEGFHDILQEILQERESRTLLVVRENITDKTLTYFNIEKARIIAVQDVINQLI